MWDIIITAVVSCITSGGLIQFINWKAAKKKANLDNDSIAVENLNKVIETLERSNSHFETVNKQREDTICRLRDELTLTEEDLQVCLPLICKRVGCKNKCPVFGNGKQFIEKFKKGEETLDYDFLNNNSDGNRNN